MEKQLVMSFSDGEDLIEGVYQAVRENDVDFGIFSEIRGELKEFKVISDNYDTPSAEGHVYLLDKVSGRVLKQKEGGHKVKLHVTLVKKGVSKANLVTGELVRGIAHGDVTLILKLRDMKNIIYS